MYDTRAWILDGLTSYTALECMPQETKDMLMAGETFALGDVLACIRAELVIDNSKRDHFHKYAGKYDAFYEAVRCGAKKMMGVETSLPLTCSEHDESPAEPQADVFGC